MAILLRALSGVAAPLVIGFLSVGPLVCGTAMPARAETDQPLDWLRKQPLTLFDWGLHTLERDLERVALWVADYGLSHDKPRVGSQHDWRSGRITAYLSFAAEPKRRTRRYCHMVFRRALAQLMRGAPEGAGQASWYLSAVFLPRGRAWVRPSRDFGERLVKVVRLEIVLRPMPSEFRPDGPRVRCSGRLDATETEIEDEVTN